MRIFNKHLLKQLSLLSAVSFFSLVSLFGQTASITEGCTPLTVDFTAPIGLPSHFWEFQNGATSVEANPSAIFNQDGLFSVTLRESAGGPIIGTIDINVFPKPQLSIAADSIIGCLPLLVSFSNTSTIDPNIGIDEINWVFGDGDAAVGNAPQHIYTDIGVFTVSLSLETAQAGCDVTENFTDFITVGGVDANFLTFPFPPVSCEPPLDVVFINNLPEELDFLWDLGNGQTFEGPEPPNQNYTDAGDYPITLTVTDEIGCSDEKTRTVNILDLGSMIPDSVCIGDTLYYQTWQNADTSSWTFPASANVGIDDENEPFVVFYEGGLQAVQFTASNYAPFCSIDSAFMIYVDQVFVDFESTPSFTCENELEVNFTASSPTATQFVWNFNSEESGFGQTATHTYTYNDTIQYSMNGLTQYYTVLMGANSLGCRDTIYYADTISVPNALFMCDVVRGCAPLTVMLYDSSASHTPIIEWHYDYGDGETATFTEETNHSHTFTEPGEYPVVLSIVNESGCEDTSYARIITVTEPLEFDFDLLPQETCADEPREFVVINPPEEEVDWWQLIEPDFTLVAEYNGCYSEHFKDIPVVTNGPAVDISYELFCENPYRVYFFSEVFDITSISWDFGDGFTSTELNPIHDYATPGDYTVTVTVFNENNDCPEYTDTRLVCIRDIEANFEIPENVCKNDLINLDATSSVDVVTSTCMNGVGYTWYFEENGRPVQTGESTTFYSFSNSGQDIITLITKDINGCRDTLSKPINVYGMEPNIMASDTLVCLPTQIDFTDLSTADTTIVSWFWDFGDNSNSSSSGPLNHTYSIGENGDTIFVKLSLTDAIGCQETVTQAIHIYEPLATIQTLPIPANLCVGETITLTANNAGNDELVLSYNWDFGVLGTSDQESTDLSINTAGIYPIILNFEETTTGCSGQTFSQIRVHDYPVADFTSTADGVDLLCYPAQIEFTDNSMSNNNLSHVWDFDNGQFSNEPMPQSSFDKGVYTVQLITQTSFGCADTTTQTYTLIGPEGGFTLDPEAICRGEEVLFTLQDTVDVSSFTWDFGDGIILDNVSPVSHLYENVPVLGDRPVTLILRSANDECVIAVTENIFIHDVAAAFGLNNTMGTVFCAGTYELSNFSTGANVYNWTLPDGVFSEEETPTFTVAPGVYDFALAAANSELGCTDTTMQSFTFTPLPEVGVLADSICIGDTAMLNLVNVYPNATFAWSPEEFIIGSSTVANPSILASETTTFTVALTDSLGCINEGSNTVYVIDPFPWMDIDSTLCPGDPLDASLIPNPGPLYTVNWNPFSPPDTLGQESLDLSLTIGDKLGCFTDTYFFQIASLSDQLEVPNVFSPNGDGVNDLFKVYSAIDFERTDLIRMESFRVYNRWGQKVYEGSGPDAFWDGMHNGEEAPSEVYLYHILVDVLKSGSTYELKGDVTLVR